MMQTVPFILDSKLLSATSKGTSKQSVKKANFYRKVCPNICIIDHTLPKIGKEIRGRKLKPLAPQGKHENDTPVSTESKFAHKLNPSLSKCGVVNGNKQPLSKIPVFQKSLSHVNRKQDDAILSAADKRQKFHESRLRVAPSCTFSDSSIPPQQKAGSYKTVLPWWEANYVTNVNIPLGSAINTCHKSILPPIKAVSTVRSGALNVPQGKKKCLLGEITHFPALCNGTTSKHRKIPHFNTVPDLPPIFSSPAAPPPSISSSLEQDGNKVTGGSEGKKAQKRMPKPAVLHLLIPV
ncbi:hypothetical protein X975_05690, partial [Stegodyphus mimosarum]